MAWVDSTIPSISVIISVYNRADFLNLVLQSLNQQSYKSFEVIIAEDGENPSIANCVRDHNGQFPHSIMHIVQPDKGFRKNKILNCAISSAHGEWLAFIDGDCLIHRTYLSQFANNFAPDICLFGRRVALGEKITHRLLLSNTLILPSLWDIFLSDSRHKEEAIALPIWNKNENKGLWGCHFCVQRKSMIDINGFDEDFTAPFYGEDTDVKRRLQLNHVRFISTRHKSIQYHLYHGKKKNKTENWAESKNLFEKKLRKSKVFCSNGIDKSYSE